MSEIKLSPRYGVNPSLMKCFFCGEDYGVALLGMMDNDTEAPRSAVFEMKPCAKCEDLMRQGIMFIEMVDGEQSVNGQRTGRMCVIRRGAVDGMPIDPPLKSNILDKRFCLVERAVWKMLGIDGAIHGAHDKTL